MRQSFGLRECKLHFAPHKMKQKLYLAAGRQSVLLRRTIFFGSHDCIYFILYTLYAQPATRN